VHGKPIARQGATAGLLSSEHSDGPYTTGTAGRTSSGTRRALAFAIAASLCLSALATLVPQSASAEGWADQRVAGPFICRADFPLTGYEALFGDLMQVQQDLTRMLGVPPAQEQSELLLFQNKQTYQAYLRQHYPQAPYRRALYIKGNGQGHVFVQKDSFRPKELPIDVRHESTHALLHAALPMVPLWLDEGLAEYFEVVPEKRVDGNPHLSSITWKSRFGMMPPLGRLEAKREVTEMDSADYAQAWAWVHFMMHGPPEAHDELIHFLADIRAGTPPGRLGERLERRMPGVEKRLVQHFKTWSRKPKSTQTVTKN